MGRIFFSFCSSLFAFRLEYLLLLLVDPSFVVSSLYCFDYQSIVPIQTHRLLSLNVVSIKLLLAAPKELGKSNALCQLTVKIRLNDFSYSKLPPHTESATRFSAIDCG